MKIFAEDELKAIEKLSALVRNICDVLRDMSVDSALLGELCVAQDILDNADSMRMSDVSSLLYVSFKALDQNSVFRDDLDSLTHNAYSFALEESVFQKNKDDVVRYVAVDEGRGGLKLASYLLLSEDDAWQIHCDVSEFLTFISPLRGCILRPENTTVYVRDLPCYGGVQVFDVRHWIDEEHYLWEHFFKHRNGYIHMDESISVLDELYKEGCVCNITPDNVLEYMKLFNFFTADRESRAYVIEGEKSEFIAHNSPFERQRYLRKLRKPEVKVLSSGGFEVSLSYVSQEFLYTGTWIVYPDGNLEFKETEILDQVKPVNV